MDQCRSRLKLSESFERHWSIQISGENHMDQSLVHTFSWGNLYGPMVLKVLPKFPPTLVLVHGWLFPERWSLEEGFCKMYASLGCGALSAQCTAGASVLGYFLSVCLTLDSAETPLLKPHFLGSRPPRPN